MVRDVEEHVGVEAASALADPVRRRVYECVAASGVPVGRDEVAAEAGIKRSLAGYHLDLLAGHGLLDVSFARRSGRSGPGAGRPAKLYARAPVEVRVQLPARDDALVAHLLATAVERDDTGSARATLREVAREAGQALGTGLVGGSRAAVIETLAERGYQAYETDEGIRLRNCPFHHLTEAHVELVCDLNHQLLGALVEASGAPLTATLQPASGHCCVLLSDLQD